MGTRRAGQFAGFDSEGKATVSGMLGGPFSEFWLGPIVRIPWKSLFFQLGWGAIGMRRDGARTDLATSSGNTDTSLRTKASVAWLLGIGAQVPLNEYFKGFFRIDSSMLEHS